MCIFSFTIITCLKKFIGIKSLNRKQCPPRLSPRIIPPCMTPALIKNIPVLSYYFVDLTNYGLPWSFTQTLVRNSWDGGESHPGAKKLLISFIRKIPLTKYQFPCYHSIQASFTAVALLLCHFF